MSPRGSRRRASPSSTLRRSIGGRCSVSLPSSPSRTPPSFARWIGDLSKTSTACSRCWSGPRSTSSSAPRSRADVARNRANRIRSAGGYGRGMFDVEEARSRFPALTRSSNGRTVAYFDGPGGTQVPRSVIEAMQRPLEEGVSNLGGVFASSRLADEITAGARQAGADLFGASEADEIVFGQNMTSLTFAMSRALARTWQPGDRIVVTSLDHDANISPW